MKRTACVAAMSVVFVLVAMAAGAQEVEKYTLRYVPDVGQKAVLALAGVLLDASLQSQSLGVTGDVSAEMATEVTAKDEEAKTSTAKLCLSKVRANLNGQLSAPTAPQPVCLTLGQTGCISRVEGEEPTNVSFMDTGGVPVVLVAVLASTLRFSDGPVAVGDEWQFEDTYQIPGLGELPISTRWKLEGMEGGRAALTSTAIAALPDFKTPNPMAPGTEMDVKAGRGYITDLKQVYDTATSQLLSSEGKLRIDAQLDMQGMTVPISLAMTFSLKPPKRAEEPTK
jgi:hypothetical protein